MQAPEALVEPTKGGRATTLTSPIHEPAPAPARHAYNDDRFEPQEDGGPAESSGLQTEELLEDDVLAETGGSTRAVSWQEQGRILAAIEDEVTNVPEPEPEPAPEPEPEPEPDDRPLGPPTAEGSLQKTPFVHLLIYMLDQRLSGTTVFTLPSGMAHSVYFHDGTPAKVRTGTMLEPLDRVLVDEGLVDEATLRGTLMEVSKKNILHGRLLVMRGLLDREKVVYALRLQVLRKVTHLFELPGETRYAYYKDDNLLASYGGPELTPTEPLAVIMAGIRLMAGDPLVDATLGKIMGRPLALHIDAEMKRFQLTRDEQSVVDLMRTRRMTIKEIVHANVAQERVVRQTVYALVVTRHLDLGVAAKPPVGLGRPPVTTEAIRQPERPAPAPARPARSVAPPACGPPRPRRLRRRLPRPPEASPGGGDPRAPRTGRDAGASAPQRARLRGRPWSARAPAPSTPPVARAPVAASERAAAASRRGRGRTSHRRRQSFRRHPSKPAASAAHAPRSEATPARGPPPPRAYGHAAADVPAADLAAPGARADRRRLCPQLARRRSAGTTKRGG